MWSKRVRAVNVVVVSGYSLMSSMTSSMVAPALETLVRELDARSELVGKMMLSTQLLGFMVGPMVWGPLSEMWGRRRVLQASNAVFLAFNAGCGGCRTAVQMIVLRFFVGAMGSAPLSLGAGTVTDLYEPEERGRAMTIFTLSPILGPCVGPIFAGWIMQGYGETHWPWIFWASTMFGGAVAVVGLIVLRETYAPVLLRRAVRRMQAQSDEALDAIYAEEKMSARLLVRPLEMLVREPVVQMTCLYQGLLYGCQYLLLSDFSRAFREAYNEGVGITTLHYIAYLIGFVVMGQVVGRGVDAVYRWLKTRHGGGKPEHKLPLLGVTGIVMPMGLILYGWALQYRLHWSVTDVGVVLIAAGIRGALTICPMYLADSITLYTASAVSASVMVRGLLGFVMPLVSPAMYGRLGEGWGNSLLALVVAVVGVASPGMLYRYGGWLRKHSRYSRHGMRVMT